MVGLPSIENREMILKTLLSKEEVENLDDKEIATMTEEYSGSDLKQCELIQQERQKDLERKSGAEKAKRSEYAQEVKDEDEVKEGKDEPMIKLRQLTMEGLRQAKNQVAASFASEGSVMSEMKQWNDLNGEGGSRKKQ